MPFAVLGLLCPHEIVNIYFCKYLFEVLNSEVDDGKGWADENGINWSKLELKRAPSEVYRAPKIHSTALQMLDRIIMENGDIS